MRYAKFFVPLLILLAAGYVFFEKKNIEKQPGIFANLGEYFFVDSASVDRVEFTSEEMTIIINKNDDSWFIESPLKAQADKAKVRDLIHGILDNPVHRILPGSEIEDMSEYGLADITHSITLYGSGKALLNLQMGDINLTGSDLYAKKGGGGEVILTAVQLMDKLMYDQNYYRNLSLINLDPGVVTRFSFTYPDSYWVLEKQDNTGNWYITEPETIRAKNTRMNRLIGQLNNLKVTQFLNQRFEGEESHGLDSPGVILEIISGEEQESLTIILGDTQVETNSVYARLSSLPEEDVLVEASIEHKLMLTADDLREDSLFPIDPAQIESLDVRERDAKNLSIYQNKQNVWKMLSPVSADVAVTTLSAFFLKLTDIRPSEFISPSQLNRLDDDVTGFESYNAKIEVELRSGYGTYEITIGNLDKEKGYYIKTSDIDGAYIVGEDLIDKFFEANKRLKGE